MNDLTRQSNNAQRESAKDWADEQALAEMAAKNQEQVQNTRELMKQGSIQEAAAVFSQEGMGIFAQIFSNSVKTAVAESMNDLRPMITEIVDERLKLMMDGMLVGMLGTSSIRQQVTAQVSSVLDQAGQTVSCNLSKVDILNMTGEKRDKPALEAVKPRKRGGRRGEPQPKRWGTDEESLVQSEILRGVANGLSLETICTQLAEVLDERTANSIEQRWQTKIRPNCKTEYDKAKQEGATVKSNNLALV